MKNWKTTYLGIIAIVIAAGHAIEALLRGQPVDWTATGASISAGMGLIAAKDHNVTGGTKEQ